VEKQYSLGGINLKDERGTILLLTIFMVIILTIIFAGMVDIGRLLIAREQNQTATDSAALASSSSNVKRMVYIIVDTTERYYQTTCCDDDGCSPCGRPDDPFNVHKVAMGTEKYLIDEEGWKNYCVPDTWSYKCDSFRMVKRWIKYDEVAKSRDEVAESFYQANMSQQSGQINKVVVYGDDNQDHPAYPSVIVYATVKIKSLFPGLFNTFPEEYQTTNCSQGSTYYKDNKTGKLINPPADWCWQDWP